MLADITGATLHMGDETADITDEDVLTQLSVLLTSVQDQGGMMAGCPFTATLALTLRDGQKLYLQLATDSCCVYRVDGRDYSYARSLVTAEGAPENSVLFSLFGLSAESVWAQD